MGRKSVNEEDSEEEEERERERERETLLGNSVHDGGSWARVVR